MKKAVVSMIAAVSLGSGVLVNTYIYGEASEKMDKQHFAKAPTEFNEKAAMNLLQLNTKNITRIDSDNQIEAAVRVSQTIWPATHKENRPGVVILAPKENWQAAVAASNLIHHPNDGPVLYYEEKGVPKLTIQEIQRLDPKGNPDGIKIIFFGEGNKRIRKELEGYQIEYVKGNSPAEFGRNSDQTYARMSGKLPQSVIIISGEEKDRLFSLPALSWVSHMPEPPLFVAGDSLPEATKDALKKRNGQANIYIVGPESAVSNKVANELKQYGKITRIAAANPTANSIAFAKYKDSDTGFGWGITEPGHGLALVSTKTPLLALSAGPFSHKGKHGPMILLEDGKPTSELYEFLALIKPTFEKDPTTGPYNHAFLLGTQAKVSFRTQGIIDEKLEIVQEGGMEH